MIISFEVENFRSIHARQEISFVASSLKDCTDGIIETDAFSEGRLLPALLIYGSNAAGKTNIIKAISYFDVLKRKNQFLFCKMPKLL